MNPRYPALFQLNTRVWQTERSQALGRPATLDDVPDEDLDRLSAQGFDWLWLLSVWQTGEAGRNVSRSEPGWRREFEETLPDLREEDIAGSGFAITAYTVLASLGGDAALARLRERLTARGLRLMLDFVPNHTGLDHPWVEAHPEYYKAASEADLMRSPGDYARVPWQGGERVLAHGRDPYFPGWPDTLQLDYAEPTTQEAMLHELETISARCDGVRCDMAMLILPDVFERTWGRRPADFWTMATRRVHLNAPDFRFMAEVYWDLEWTMLEHGFDYAYDKRLYDRLRTGAAGSVRDHLSAGLDYQDHLARFLENHDEPRAAATFPFDVHRAAAVITFLSPGLRFLHQGQRDGRRVRIPMHLGRGPEEPLDEAIASFYDVLLACLREPSLRDGDWRLLDVQAAWPGNDSSDGFVAFSWTGPGDRRFLVTVNYAAHEGQCYVGLPWDDLADRSWRLRDRLGTAEYDREGADLAGSGLYLDLPAWGFHAFEVSPLAEGP
jgi:hypothetical protein